MEHIEALGWIKEKFDDEYFNARLEMTRDLPHDARYRNYRRRTDAAIKTATELWGEVNGSVDAIPRIMEQVSSENHLRNNEVQLVQQYVFGS